MNSIEFTIYGKPRPAGSKRHVGNGILVDSSGEKGKSWRASVQSAARQHFTGELMREPLLETAAARKNGD